MDLLIEAKAAFRLWFNNSKTCFNPYDKECWPAESVNIGLGRRALIFTISLRYSFGKSSSRRPARNRP
jgi:hypothetical protein